MTKKWEYLFEKDCAMYRLNELGADGWELVSAQILRGAFSADIAYFFKRPLTEPKPEE